MLCISGSSSSKVTALTLDDVMIGRRNYMADDEMIETMSLVTTISSVFNLSSKFTEILANETKFR